MPLFLWKQVKDLEEGRTRWKKKILTAVRAIQWSLSAPWHSCQILHDSTASVGLTAARNCSTKALLNSVFCFDPVVLMNDTAGKCVIHIYRLSYLSEQWYSTRYHHCFSTSRISVWCWYLYWRHLMTAPGRKRKKSRLYWLDFPLE